MLFYIYFDMLANYIRENQLENYPMEIKKDSIEITVRCSENIFIIYKLIPSNRKNILTESKILIYDKMFCKYDLIDEERAAELRGIKL